MVICQRCKKSVTSYANGKRCRKCYNAYMREYMLCRYHKRRTVILERLGGVCIDCGATENLELDHNNRLDKRYDVAKIWSYKKYDKEIEKCVLRCKLCHATKSSREMSVSHGGGLTGKKNCYCELCGPLKAAYIREYRKVHPRKR